MLRRRLTALLLASCLAIPQADAIPLGGSAPASAPTDAMASCLAGMTPGSWKAAGLCVNTAPTISSVFWSCATQPCAGSPASPAAPTVTDLGGGAEQNGFVNNWVGGVYDSDDNILMVFGGGHVSYYGTEIYGFSLSSLTWSRLNVPHSLVGFTKGTSANTFPDGQPLADHTYNGMTYIPGKGLYKVCTSAQDTGGFGPNSFTIQPSTLSPAQYAVWTAIAQPDPAICGGQFAVWDPTSNAIYANGGSASSPLQKLASPFTGAWTASAGNSIMPNSGMTGAIQPGSQVVYVGGGSIRAASLSTGNNLATTATGDTTCQGGSYPGFDWNSKNSLFMCWAGGTTLYELNPATYLWAAHTATGTAPSCSEPEAPGCIGGTEANGTFGRFRCLMPKYNACIALNSTLDQVYIWRSDQ